MAFTIPSIFTAIDKFTAPLRSMTGSLNKFIGVSESGVARQERLFKKLTPALSETSKQFLDIASSAAIAAGAIASMGFTVDQIIAFEKAVASFRTIVSDLSDKDFAAFRSQITKVAVDTKKSAVDVAASFEKIAGLNADFAKTADGLGLVSTAAITLAKASGDELGPSAESLVGIMNQFGFAADKADKTINVLAAGQAVGAANISQTAEALKVFGAVAKSSNTTIEQSVGLIETLAAKSIMGSEAGTALRGSFVRLQKAGLGYKTGQFSINNALDDAKKKVDHLVGAKAKDAYITKLFGLENLTAGKILLESRDKIKDFTASVTGTTEAQKAAAINTNTLGNRIDELKNKWINLVTSSDATNTSLENVKKAVVYLTDNMASILSIGAKVLVFFALWKAWIILSKAAVFAYNIALGINAVISGQMALAMRTNTVALAAYSVITNVATAAQWLLNAAMTANPIGLIIVAIAALIAIVILVIKYWDEWGAALTIFMGPLGLVIALVKSVYDNWDLVKKGFQDGGIIGGLKAIGKVLLDVLLKPLEVLLGVIAHLPGKMGEMAKAGQDAIADFRHGMGLGGEYFDGSQPAIDPNKIQRDGLAAMINGTVKQQVEVKVSADKGSNAEVTKRGNGLPKTTSTVGGFGPNYGMR